MRNEFEIKCNVAATKHAELINAELIINAETALALG